MKTAAMKYNKLGRWLEERKRAKKVEHIGELKPGKGQKMDVLNRIKKSVSNVLPGNPLSRDFDIQSQVGSAGPGMLWKIYSAVKKSTKEPASVFLFEKKMVDRHSKRDKDLIFDALRKGVQQLTKLRHPRVLSVIHPLEENRETLAFAAEPVFSSLANALGCHENIQGNPKMLSDFTLYEVEIKHGLLQLLEALAFLHNDVKMLHRNVCPPSIILTKSGVWKLSGFEFSQLAQDTQEANPVYSCVEWNANTPRETNPLLDFMAPEYEIMKMCSPSSDMFSFGVLLYSLYNKGKPLYECQGELSNFRRKAEELSSIRGTISKSIPSEMVENVKLLLNMEQAIRPDALQMSKVPFFEDMACMALQYVDTLYQRDNIEKSNFFKGLPKIIERLPKRVNQQRILPALFTEGMNSTMVPFILPSIFFIAEQSTNEEYRTLVLPDLIPYFKIKEPVQVMLMLLQNMNLLLSKTPTAQIQAYVFPLIFSALESDSPQIQELCLNIIPTFADLIDYSTLKSSLIPRIKKLCLGTSVLYVRVNSLLCMGKLMEQMDKWYVLDEVLPFLREIPTREPAVLMSILGIHKIALSESKLGITKDVMASKVLPFLIPLSIDNNLNLSQFNAYMMVVKEMLTKVESEHRTKLEQLDQIHSEHKVIEIGQIMGNNDSGEKPKTSFMDQFMAGFGFGQSSQSNSTKQLATSGSSDRLASKAATDSTPKKPVLSIEEKQRLAKQQEQERELKAKQPLTAQSLSTTKKTLSSSSSSPSVPKSSTNASGPKDLTKTLLNTNNFQQGNRGGGNLDGMSHSVNWGSASSSKTNYSNYGTPMSSPASSTSSLYSSSSKSNIDMSSIDSLLPSSTFSSSSSSSSSTITGSHKQSMTTMSSGMGLKPQQPSPMMMPMQQQQPQSMMMMGQHQQQQPPLPTQYSSFPMGGGQYGQGGMMNMNTGGGWGVQPGGIAMGTPGGFHMTSQNSPSMMRMGTPQNGGMGSTPSKALSNDDLKDFLG